MRFGRREQAVELLMTAFEKGSQGNDYSNAYRIATLHAQLGSTDEALDWLQKAMELRHVNRPGVATDAAFRSLADDPRFREIAGLAPEGELDREAQWLYDLDFLMAEIRRMNPRPGGHPDGGQVHRAIEALKGQVTVLDDTKVIF